MSTGFKLLSARKEAMQLVDFVKNLHDRKALEKREAKRLFLGGEGFVAWPGPAFRKFVDEVIVGNRMASGGFVVDGHSVTLADLSVPVLYFVGSRDEMGRPASVRGIRRAAPKVRQMYEVPLRAGHFGLVVGSTALTVTWPSVIDWMKWREGIGELPKTAIDVRAAVVPDAFARRKPADHDDEDADDADADAEHDESALELARELAGKTAKAAMDRLGELSEDVGHYLDNARWQLPRLQRLRGLRDDTVISASKTLAEQAAKIGDRTFFLFRGRAFTYAESNRRVDAVVRGLLGSGVQVGQRVGVMMKSRPSHLSVVTALGRIGAVAVLLSPALTRAVLPRALQLGECDIVIADPDNATTACAVAAEGGGRVKVFVLGGVGEVPWQPGAPRTLPDGVIDLEAIDPDAVALPTWYAPDPGRARDLAMIFITANAYDAPRAQRITNRRWAFSALGAAAATTLTTRDTVYCCLPLHHPSGTLVAVGSALVGGARLALGSAREPAAMWDEIRRYGASVMFYAGDLCRQLVDAPPVLGERNHPVRLFAGSGMRSDVWRRLNERFGGATIVELYASTEAHVVLANTAGKKIGSVGRPLPGSPDVAIAAWDFARDELVRDGDGRLVHARLDEPGMLVAAMSRRAGADIAHIDPRRLIRDAFAEGDTWFVTGDLFRVDVAGDYWFVDRQGHTIQTPHGMVASTAIEDALYACPGVASCVAMSRGDVPVAAIMVRRTLDLGELSAAVAKLPEYARPQRVRVVAALPQTDGYRPIKAAVRDLDFGSRDTLVWDPRAQRYQ
jgi:putative long chain acyl-CoA synthase